MRTSPSELCRKLNRKPCRLSTGTLALAATLLCASLTVGFAQQPTPLLTQPADKLVSILKSDASQKEKADACRQLAVIGTRDAVPALAALLPDEMMNHVARYALETIPDPSVDQAFRDALTTLKGRPLVGVIGSIGVRKDAQSVGSLAKLLQDSDADVAQAAARALGKIATPPAVEALRSALGTARAGNQLAVCEGLLRAAESLHSKGDTKGAHAIYDQLRGIDSAHQVKTAALRGAILTGGNDGVVLLRELLQSKDYLLFSAAVRATYELPGTEATRALAAELPKLPDDDHKLLVIQALAKRSDAAGLPALTAAANTGSKPVQIAAIQALAETGNPTAAPELVKLLGSSNRDVSQAALESLAGLRGKEVDGTVESMLKSREPAQRAAAVELIGRRRMTACLPGLLQAATDTDAQVRPAALSKVGELGGPGEAKALLDLLPKLSTTQDLDAAEQALSTLCAKAQAPDACAEKLTAKLPAAQPAQKSVLLRVLSSVGGPGALKAVRAAVNDPNPEVHAAAIRALGSWKTADAGPDLLELAKSASNPTDQTLCLCSYLGLAANPDFPAAQRLSMCREAGNLAKGAEDKKLLLSALGSVESSEAVALIVPYLDDPTTKEEASAAVASIADKLLKGQQSAQAAPKLIAPLERVAQATANEELAKRAKALLQQARKKAGSG